MSEIGSTIFTFGLLDEPAAQAIIQWRYDEPYAIYNLDKSALQALLDPKNAYHAVRDGQGNLIGFCCFGPDAQVPGGDYSDETVLDIGLGLRPDLTGRGTGLTFLQAILCFAEATFHTSHFRVTVARFNERSLRAHERAGFKRQGVFVTDSDGMKRQFVQLRKDAH